MYMPSQQPKPSLINELYGNARFKTFRANNELFMRIDAVRREDDSNEILMYNALL